MSLKRPDLYLPPFDRAAGRPLLAVGELQRDRTLRELAMLNIDGFSTIEYEHQMRAFGGDLVGVPLAAGFGHR